ncbi:hypothetical protein HBB16_06955 [Pseudonocardia sp. MCCB 268]|nr:hypothetical protein [Pseudonocardia cytotoxica]
MAAQNVDGNGRALNTTIRNLGGLGDAQRVQRGPVRTVELQKFVATLRENDPGVRELNGKLADVTGFLAGQRGELAGRCTSVLRPRRGRRLRQGQPGHAEVERDKLASVSQRSWTTSGRWPRSRTPAWPLSNPTNIYNGSSRHFGHPRANINELAMPAPVPLCKILQVAGSAPDRRAGRADRTMCNGLVDRRQRAVPMLHRRRSSTKPSRAAPRTRRCRS